MKTILLNEADIKQKIKRIAFQLIEDNFEEKNITIIGIVPNGCELAEMIKNEIGLINKSIKISLLELSLNKQEPLSEKIQVKGDVSKITNNFVLLVDDVANTGKTSFFALKPLIELNPKKVQVAVLVDREHKQFPIASDYVGLSLSTTLKEHILVSFENDKVEAYLV
jgi:pyrimidine operon attenuation protein/uracil phosphoribosyltransferase